MNEAIDDAVIDVLLQEQLGGCAAPDLRARVRVRHAGGGAAAAAARLAAAEVTVATGRTARRVAAAVLLLGLGVVTFVALRAAAGPQASPAPAAPPPESGTAQTTEAGRQDPGAKHAVGLRVLDDHDSPVQVCGVTLLAVSDKSAWGFQPVRDLPVWQLRPSDFRDNFATLGDVPPGTFVAVVEAFPYVRAFSEPFTVGDGQAKARVSVRLDHGTEVVGTVVAAAKGPVADAVVRLEPHALPSDSPMAGFFATIGAIGPVNLAELFTTDRARTGADGTFRFARVVAGRYAIVVEHPDHCRAEADDLRVGRGKQVAVPALVLTTGTLLQGTVRDADGQPAGGVELTISADTKPVEGVVKFDRATAERAWRIASGQDGTFCLGFRLRPGRYRVAPVPKADGNPLQQLTSIQAAAVVVTIEPGAERAQADIALAR